ncbi:MAG: hypothetical protein H6657_14145 [Ardenticatenaceae bacterium]|nr:hypothetical protein [Ardenticatenaceae bacterium]
MRPIELNAITDFLLACEVFFFAGRFFEFQKEPLSAAWWWNLSIIILAVTALIGGIDHGFLDISNHPYRICVTKVNWAFLGVLAFTIIMTISQQYFSDLGQTVLLVIGVVQFVVYLIFLMHNDNFIFVSLNIAPVMIFLLVLVVLNFRIAPQSLDMIIGILILIVGSLVQGFKVSTFHPLDGNGLGHLIVMVAVVFLYRGGVILNTQA